MDWLNLKAYKFDQISNLGFQSSGNLFLIWKVDFEFQLAFEKLVIDPCFSEIEQKKVIRQTW